MAHYNKETMEIELSKDDIESMRPTRKLDVESIMNVVVWGNKDGVMTPKFDERAEEDALADYNRN